MYKTTVKVDGMMCVMCESHINEAMKKNFKIKKISSSHEKGLTEIVSENELSESKINEVIEEAGYKAVSVESKPYEKKGLGIFGKNK